MDLPLTENLVPTLDAGTVVSTAPESVVPASTTENPPPSQPSDDAAWSGRLSGVSGNARQTAASASPAAAAPCLSMQKFLRIVGQLPLVVFVRTQDARVKI